MLTNLAKLHELVAEAFYTTRFSVSFPVRLTVRNMQKNDKPLIILSVRNHLILLHLLV
jgi:hypothetical protein